MKALKFRLRCTELLILFVLVVAFVSVKCARSVFFNLFKFNQDFVEPLYDIKHLVSHATEDVDLLA